MFVYSDFIVKKKKKKVTSGQSDIPTAQTII